MTPREFLRQRELPTLTGEALRALGHDVLTARDAGNAGQGIPDDAVLAFATSGRRAVLTLNRRDFIRLHAKSSTHAGIVVCTEDGDFAGQAQRIHDAVTSAGDLVGVLLRVNRPVPA